MAYIFRRLAFLTGARAEIYPLARGWEVVVRGYIGKERYTAAEPYRSRREARDRRVQINQEGKALVASIEEVLYPLSLIVAKFDPEYQPVTPPSAPPPNIRIQPYTLVKDLYR